MLWLFFAAAFIGWLVMYLFDDTEWQDIAVAMLTYPAATLVLYGTASLMGSCSATP